jgi:hypothetical protein
LLRLRPAFAECETNFATVNQSYAGEIQSGRFWVIPDCNRSHRIQLLWCAVRILWLLLRIRPDVVVSTGAAPGYFAIRFGRLLGKRTIWVDSFANAEELSMSGRLAGRHARLWLTQWPHLAEPNGPLYRGSVL